MSPPLVQRSESGLLKLASPKCELLFDVFNGELGRVHLGRMLAGNDAGRLVTLRKLPGAPGSELAAAIDLARSIAHPKLAKSLGVVRTDDAWMFAREYIPGVALCELTQAVASRGEQVKASVAVRIILDLVSAAVAARALLPSSSELTCIYAESAWIADFGESFLCEVPVSAILAESARERGDEPTLVGENANTDYDTRAAGLLLLDLACGSSQPSSLADPTLAAEIRQVAARATGRAGATNYETLEALVDDLRGLDPTLIASDDEVTRELRRLMGSVLDTRSQKLAMTERVALQESGQDETKFFRAASVSAQRETARPPPEVAHSAPPAGAHSSKQRIGARSDPPEDQTTIFRRPKDEDLASELGVVNAPIRIELAKAKLTAHSEPAAAAPPSAPPTPSDEPETAVDFRPGSGRRLALALVLLVALVAFGLTTDVTSLRGSSATQSSLHWLRSLSGKAARLLH